MIETITSPEHIEVKVDGVTLAKFEGIDRIEGHIEEFDQLRLPGSRLIEIARWLLKQAVSRAETEEDRP